MKIKDDSRKVEQGDIFIALKKNHDGHNYIQDAINNGATKIICEYGNYQNSEVVTNTREYLYQYLTENYYDYIKDLKLIGVTGTNGKTTTCFLIYQALNMLGIKCAYIGTIGFYMEEKIRDLNNTTPDIIDIYEMLIKCQENGYQYVVMEVSSHALELGRVETLKFDYAIFTNLTQDHLDFHKTMDEYAKAKLKLFKKLKNNSISLVNFDSDYKDFFMQKNSITYGLNGGDYYLKSYNINPSYSLFNVNDMMYETKLIGKHNLYNILCLISFLNILNIDEEKIKNTVKKIQAPLGRMDVINKDGKTVIVDYAHTPDAVENILNSVKELDASKINTIIGCGGNRDKSKRPIMAKIATSLSDYVIFTSDNPRNENPQNIIDDMLQNLDASNYEIELNRKKAIIKGIQKLANNDILLVLGKGHETYQVINDEKIDFDDKKIVIDNL